MFDAIFQFVNSLFVKGVLAATPTLVPSDQIMINEENLGFKIPSMSTFLTFAIRGFFVLAGLLALMFLLLGALGWITSGGNKESVDKARDKITAAILGVIIIVAVLAIMATLELVVFKSKLCFGITCDLILPNLLQKTGP